MVMMMMANIMERLFERVMPIPVTGCWIWEGSDSGNGYGKVSIGGRDCMFHRVVYELLVGPIPPDRVLDHRCRVRRCCNPDHLEPVTVRVNTHRGDAILRSEEHTSELQSLMRISYAVFCLKKKNITCSHCIKQNKLEINTNQE